jgi:hypothetical protein
VVERKCKKGIRIDGLAVGKIWHKDEKKKKRKKRKKIRKRNE